MNRIVGDLIADWKHVRHQIGLWQALNKAVQWMMGQVYREMILLKLDINPDKPFPIQTPGIPVMVRCAKPADLAKLQEFHESSRFRHSSRIKGFARLLHSNDVGFVALNGEEMAAYAWVNIGPTRELDRRRIHLTSQDAFLHTAYTFRRFRRQGLHTALIGHRIRFAQEQKCLRAYTLVSTDNHASLRSMQGAGFHKVECLTFLGLINKELVLHRRVGV